MNVDLQAAALLIRELGASIVEWVDDDLGGHALAYAAAGWEIFPANGKIPLTMHGVLDATSDLQQVLEWWSRWPLANIAGRVPAGCVVIDIDPRHDGDKSWVRLTAEHGDTDTRKVVTGRGDGGMHVYVGHPGGTVKGKLQRYDDSEQLVALPGLDVKTHAGYVMLPPSIHPDSRKPYRWVDVTTPIAACPAWLADLLHPLPRNVSNRRQTARQFDGDSIADWYSTTHSWRDVLTGWTLVGNGGDGDSDGSRWRHPTATHAWSATVKHGCLFVYSQNTPFDQTEAEAPHGYTRFRAYAVLEHRGNLSDAARAAAQLRKVAA